MKVARLTHSFPLQHIKSKIEYALELRTETPAPLDFMIGALTYFSGICGTKFSKKCNFFKKLRI
jgi:hypothetical protein